MAKQFVTAYFEGELVKEPIICELGRECDVIPNIFRADVQAEEGSESALQEAMEYLRVRGVRPEPAKEEDLPA